MSIKKKQYSAIVLSSSFFKVATKEETGKESVLSNSKRMKVLDGEEEEEKEWEEVEIENLSKQYLKRI